MPSQKTSFRISVMESLLLLFLVVVLVVNDDDSTVGSCFDRGMLAAGVEAAAGVRVVIVRLHIVGDERFNGDMHYDDLQEVAVMMVVVLYM
jgi:hypothetical protein